MYREAPGHVRRQQQLPSAGLHSIFDDGEIAGVFAFTRVAATRALAKHLIGLGHGAGQLALQFGSQGVTLQNIFIR